MQINLNVRAKMFIALALSVLLCGLANADENDLAWSTFLGGTSMDDVWGMALDGEGNAYVIGGTRSDDFPTTAGAFDTTHNGPPQKMDAFVAKLNAAGSALDYATYLGGSAFEYEFCIAVDGEGNAYASGWTQSTDFPTTAGAFDTTHNGYNDVFVAKLNATGSTLVYATFLGGDSLDQGRFIAVDGEGNAYVSGSTDSDDFPTTVGAFDTIHNGVRDVFVAKLNPTGNTLVYATFLGGSNNDRGRDIAVDNLGNAYVTGWTRSDDFPTTAGAFDTTLGGDRDAYVIKLNATGSALDYATFLGGGSYDYGLGIALDTSGNAYVTGTTESDDFPTTAGAFDTTHNSPGISDVFVATLNPTGTTLVYATFLGGSNYDGRPDRGGNIALDTSGNAYVTGFTYSENFPTTAGAFDTTHNGISDVFVATLNPTGSALVYATFLGGSGDERGKVIVLDSFGNAYVTGPTYSSDFPTTAGAFDTSYNGGEDAFVAKLSLGGDSTPPEAIDDVTAAVESGAKVTSGDIRLTWSEPYDDMGVTRYVVYRSTSASSPGDSLAGTLDTTFADVGAAGTVGTNYFYTVKAVDLAGNWSEESNRVGEFDRNLISGE